MKMPPLLLVHGAGGGAWEWAVWLRVLAAHATHAQALELQPAAAGLAATTLHDYVRQLHAAAAAPGPAPVLVGASLGGLLVLMAATSIRPAAVVLVNPLPPAPWHAALPAAGPHPAIIPWARQASLASTRRALPDADEATCEWAWRRWRDESGAVLDAARAGVDVARPQCPMLVIAAEDDREVPPAVSVQVATGWSTDLLRLPRCSHVGPLLGRRATHCARMVQSWLELACAPGPTSA
jgi:pimeloyl-ACP methyl ester carboxylesterase